MADVVIAEGPDGAGKSSTIEYLLDLRPDLFRHIATPRKPNKLTRFTDEYERTFEDYLISLPSDKLVLLDRHVQSDIVYSGIRGEATIVRSAYERLAYLQSKVNVYELYLLPEHIAYGSYSDDLIELSSEQYEQICRQYAGLARQRFLQNKPGHVLVLMGDERWQPSALTSFIAKMEQSANGI